MILSRRLMLPLTLAAAFAAAFLFNGSAIAQQTPVQQIPVPQATAQQPPAPQLPGNVNGTVLDEHGNPIIGAQVTLTHGNPVARQQVLTGDNGDFSFNNIPAGAFQIAVTAPPFADESFSGTLTSGQTFIVPQFTLTLATVNTTVRVQPQAVIAEHQIKQEEQQRVLKVIPNFYVTYIPNAAPLDTKQKFELSWRDAIDPVTFILIGATAGMQQAQNEFPGYGQGAAGYGKRYGASYADFATGTLFGSVVFPAILKQDPRYFYKATGSKRQRVMYAIANAVICKGDNGHWQPNYSSILGNLVSGGIANAYYPPQNRGVGLTFEVTGVGVALTGAANIAQEFIIPKFTSHKPKPDQTSAP
jgi:hypothetical protein